MNIKMQYGNSVDSSNHEVESGIAGHAQNNRPNSPWCSKLEMKDDEWITSVQFSVYKVVGHWPVPIGVKLITNKKQV